MYKMPALRFFVNEKRVSTAVPLKDGSILQVYPEKRNFSNKGAWTLHWSSAPAAKPSVRIDGTIPTATASSASAKGPSPRRRSTRVNQKDWGHSEVSTCTMGPGQYYIGDLCYALSDDVYEKVFGFLGGYESGKYVNKDGTTFFVDNTYGGDGLFTGSDGKEFSVDAGIIGICPVSLMEKDGDGGNVYEFKDRTKCTAKDGVFTFKSPSLNLVIDTQ